MFDKSLRPFIKHAVFLHDHSNPLADLIRVSMKSGEITELQTAAVLTVV